MHHPGHSGGGCPKCVINMLKIAALARLLANRAGAIAEAESLANMAEAAASIHAALGLKPNAGPKHRCEHAIQLMRWISGAEAQDATVMNAWSAEILEDIAELVAPK